MSPLVAMEMENLVIKCLIDLFLEYVSTLEKVISMEIATINRDKYVHGISSEIQIQQISVLANLSTLQGLFSRIIRCSFHSVNQYVIGAEHKSVDNFSFIQEKSTKVRASFCSQFACRVMSTQYEQQIIPEVNCGDKQDSSISHGMMPSMPWQVRDFNFLLDLSNVNILIQRPNLKFYLLD